MWIKRDFQDTFLQISPLPAVLIKGMRQCGKSSVLKRISAPKMEIAHLDHLELRQLAEENPALFFKQFPPPILIDEVQYAPNLFPQMKLMIDEARHARLTDGGKKIPVQFMMTGSEQTEIRQKINESLGGRMSEYTLHPLSIHELKRHNTHFDIRTLFLKGGWPELHIDLSLHPQDFLNQLIDTFIGKDIARKQGVEKIQSFMKALRLLAARSGQLLNVSEIAAQVSVKSPALHDWINLLEENYVLTQLPSFVANLSKRVVKSKKIFINDLGLMTRLQGWLEVEPLFVSPMMGHCFETLVYTEILRTKDHFNKRWNIYYWRTKHGEEIDFIVEDERGKRMAIEAKVTGTDVNPTEYLKHVDPDHPIYIVTLAGVPVKKSSRCIEVPITELAETLLSVLG